MQNLNDAAGPSVYCSLQPRQQQRRDAVTEDGKVVFQTTQELDLQNKSFKLESKFGLQNEAKPKLRKK